MPSRMPFRMMSTAAWSVPGPCKKRQLRPRTWSRVYPVRSRKPCDTYTMGLSGRLGSEMAKFCCDPDSAFMRRKSGSINVFTGPKPDGVGTGVNSDPSPDPTFFSSSSARSGSSDLMMFFSVAISPCSPWICSCKLSRRNFFRSRLRLACSLLRSLRSIFCASVSSGFPPGPTAFGSRSSASAGEVEAPAALAAVTPPVVAYMGFDAAVISSALRLAGGAASPMGRPASPAPPPGIGKSPK
mmetsp:Transcript_28845/g.67655  ORF Transcript_28845/g.67655 Transcript_28845/m.67655 type:complete len:241 (-) Transcript_28845:245-967(-)